MFLTRYQKSREELDSERFWHFQLTKECLAS
ncbi:hypothetical protein E2C01_049299 [Portunus trituberculatus]|uniref:Uncharacterized protein n=1 Tax=Portunus trituberculatus TaxID=210409 RepID=A0A5B7GCS1_PORTR|nr:hypothetical protein [Portunus trituberculatus]